MFVASISVNSINSWLGDSVGQGHVFTYSPFSYNTSGLLWASTWFWLVFVFRPLHPYVAGLHSSDDKWSKDPPMTIAECH